MSRTFADAMAEVQNRANMVRKEVHAEAWGGEIAPGGRGIVVNEKPLPSSELEAQIAEVHAQRNQSVKDMTKENWDETIPVTDIATVDHINKVEEAKKAIQTNKSTSLLDQWKKNNIPQSGALTSPIPTMKEPPLVKEEEMENEQEHVEESAFGDAFRRNKEGSTFTFRGKQYKRETAGAGKPSTGLSDGRPKSSISPAPSTVNAKGADKPFFKPGVSPNAPRNAGDSANMSKPAAERTVAPKPTVNRDGGPSLTGAPRASEFSTPRPAPAAAAPKMPGDDASNFVKKQMAKESTNPLIDAFFALQEKQGNMFAEAKKKSSSKSQAGKYNNGDKDAIEDDQGKGEVATSQAPGAMSESIQKPARVSMFDPAGGYSRTAGSADGAAALKERIAAAWNNLSTGYPATQPAITGMSAEMAADAAALREETEVLDEAPKKKDHDLAALAAAAISKGHPVKKLPAGKAEGWADLNVKSSTGGGVSKINSHSGTKTKARFREEVEFSEEELAHIQAVMENNPEGNAIAGRDPNAKQGDSDKSTVGGIANESKKNGIRR